MTTQNPPPARPARKPTAKPTAKAQPAGLTDAAKRHLERAGLMDPFTGATRRAQPARCVGCSAMVWRGLDARWMARDVDADPMPLTAMGEAQARVGGWRTVTLRFLGDRYELDLRDQFHIRGEPAGTVNNCDVLTVHICGRTIDALAHGRSRIVIARAAALTDECPF